ncbi:MAG: LysM peptidoglycan-binding domain-containing protein [Lentisphaeraceae bacterium]|nr:LysM peptidoglycan-binding domain-containing protein [Lentisphaeraceae bacterium]
MKDRLVRTGLVTVSTAGFLLFGSCSTFKPKAPRDDIFNNRGGHMPPPTSVQGGYVPSGPTVVAPVQGSSVILNAPSGPGRDIIIDDQGPINNPPVTTYKAPEVSNLTYTVKRNDSLWKVAHNHGVTVDELARANNMPKTSGLKIGQKLSLPIGAKYNPVASKPSKSSSNKTSGSYTVKKGDSLSVIAWRYKTSVSAIKSANGLKSNNIRIGQKLTIPGGNSPRSGGSSSSSSYAPVSGNVYTVKKGDSLSVIAQRFGTSTKSLKAANGLKNNNIIVGKKLVIPADAKNKVGQPTAKQDKIKKTLTEKKPKPKKVEEPKFEPEVKEEPKEFTNDLPEPKKTEDPLEEPSAPEAKSEADPLANMKLMDVLVVESDTLESLSSDFNTTKELILKANKEVKGNEDLKPGMVIKVPRAQ